jgi:hypothetical protein
VDVIQREFGISQAAVSQLYSVDPTSLQHVDTWLDQFRGFWKQRLTALTTEMARGQRERRGGRS